MFILLVPESTKSIKMGSMRMGQKYEDKIHAKVKTQAKSKNSRRDILFM